MFSQFFLLTLYMQQVLHYSALKTGVAYIALTLTIIVCSGVAQALVTRIGVRRVAARRDGRAAAGLVLFTQPAGARHYFWDLFPAFLLSGRRPRASRSCRCRSRRSPESGQAEAGLASGLINTSQQIGGAIGVAIATTIATTYTAHFVNAHAGATALGGAALTHGFEITFYVLAGFAIAGAVVAALLIERKPNEVVIEAALPEAA